MKSGEKAMKAMSDVQLLEHVGVVLYGDAAWRQALAADLGVSKSSVYSVTQKGEPLSKRYRVRLEEFARSMPETLARRQADNLRLLGNLSAHLRDRWTEN